MHTTKFLTDEEIQVRHRQVMRLLESAAIGFEDDAVNIDDTQRVEIEQLLDQIDGLVDQLHTIAADIEVG